ncbi:MAG: alpha/beta fold hydrolase [Hyphomicrobiaceae bacterium]
MSALAELFPGFSEERVTVRGVEIFARVGGHGPPLLLLHGYPETHACWHRVAPALARHFTVIAPDLRGYGRSGCPSTDGNYRAYSKRTMALDMAALMTAMGFERFRVMGHDRGARVGFRLALDAANRIERLVLLDVITMGDIARLRAEGFKFGMLHGVFLSQPAPLPETLIIQDPRDWVESRFRRATLAKSPDVIHPVAMADYIDMLSQADRVHATCEDYRSSERIDLALDDSDREAGVRIACPVQVLWATEGSLAEIADPLAVWAPWCAHLVGSPIESGHFIPEENPAALIAQSLPFLLAKEA